MLYKLHLVGMAVIMMSGITVATEETVEAPGVGEEALLYRAADVLAALNVPAHDLFTGTLVAVSAADMISVDRDGAPVRLRLYGVDSPEQDQAFFASARDALVERALNEFVMVHILTVDSMEIPVALVADVEGRSLNHWLVLNGHAWWDERNAPKDGTLRKLNADAVINERGLFAEPAALAPWDYRNSHELPDFSYTLEADEPEPAPVAAAPAPEEEDPVSLSARGTMTEDRPRAPAPATAPDAAPQATPGESAPSMSIPGLPDAMLDGVDVGELFMRHQPRIATDAAGNPLGLTVSDVAGIPQATQYGFREGDIVSQVNGIPITSEAQIFGLIPQFMDVRTFQVEVLRNGQRVTIPINVR